MKEAEIGSWQVESFICCSQRKEEEIMDKQVDYIYSDIWDMNDHSIRWCTVIVYTDGTEEVILDN